MVKRKHKPLIRGPAGAALERIGKYLEGRSVEELTDLGVTALTAVAGWNAGEELKLNTSQKLSMAAVGPMAYRLARAPNIAASVAGIAVLASYGLINLIPDFSAPENVDEIEPWVKRIIDAIAPKDILFGSATRIGGALGILLGKQLFGIESPIPTPVVWPEGWYVHNIPEIAFYSARHTQCGTYIEAQSEDELRGLMNIHVCPSPPPYIPPEPSPPPYIPPSPPPYIPPTPEPPPTPPPQDPKANFTVQDQGVMRCVVWASGERSCFNTLEAKAMQDLQECMNDPVACWNRRFGPQPGE